MIKKYRKLPVVIEAAEWKGTESIPDMMRLGFIKTFVTDDKKLVIDTLEGKMIADIGDFIIKGIKGEFYPCKPDIFWKTYEEVL